MALAAKWGHAVSLIDDLWRSTQLSVEESRRDHIDARKLAPLSSQAFAEVGDCCFASIINLTSLALLKVVGESNVPADREVHLRCVPKYSRL